MSLHAISAGELSWVEAWDLTSEILRDPSSHTNASLANWSWVPTPEETAHADHFEWWVNAKRAKNTTPYRHVRPWTKAPRPEPGVVSEDDRAQRERLALMLGLARDETPAQPE